MVSGSPISQGFCANSSPCSPGCRFLDPCKEQNSRLCSAQASIGRVEVDRWHRTGSTRATFERLNFFDPVHSGKIHVADIETASSCTAAVSELPGRAGKDGIPRDHHRALAVPPCKEDLSEAAMALALLPLIDRRGVGLLVLQFSWTAGSWPKVGGGRQSGRISEYQKLRVPLTLELSYNRAWERSLTAE